jgi:hypothetical protein
MRRMTSSGSSLPIPWPSKSSAIVTLERMPPSSGSTVMSALGLNGPSTPRTDQVLGGLIWVISCVVVCSTRPIRRVVVNLVPTPAGRPVSMRTRRTSCCHCGNRDGSVT